APPDRPPARAGAGRMGSDWAPRWERTLPSGCRRPGSAPAPPDAPAPATAPAAALLLGGVPPHAARRLPMRLGSAGSAGGEWVTTSSGKATKVEVWPGCPSWPPDLRSLFRRWLRARRCRPSLVGGLWLWWLSLATRSRRA